jgi:hypothetical protein
VSAADSLLAIKPRSGDFQRSIEDIHWQARDQPRSKACCQSGVDVDQDSGLRESKSAAKLKVGRLQSKAASEPSKGNEPQ